MRDDERELAHRGVARLEQHAAECDDCAASALPLAGIAAGLSSYSVALDAVALSRRVLAAVRPELARLASAWFWRRVGRGVLFALVPLPAVLLFDAWVLSYFYEWAAGLLPDAVATYLVVSYGALLLLLFAITYAAIPVVLAREAWHRSVAQFEAVS